MNARARRSQEPARRRTDGPPQAAPTEDPRQRENQRMWRALLDAATESAALVDVHGTFLAVNATAARRVGKSVEEIVGQNVLDVFEPPVAQARLERMQEVARTGQDARFEDQRNGRSYDNTIVPILDEQGKVTCLAVFGRDITDRKLFDQQLQASLREKEKLLKDLHEMNEQLKAMAHSDDLTGLANRRSFFTALNRELSRIRRYGGSAALALLDVDHFKALNDAHGHALGDRVLVELGRILRAQARSSDLVARYGGDEFVVLMPSTPLQAAAGVLERIRADLAHCGISPGGQPIPVKFSAGLCAAADGQTTADALLARADQALYQAKQAGRDRTVTAP